MILGRLLYWAGFFAAIAVTPVHGRLGWFLLGVCIGIMAIGIYMPWEKKDV